MRKELGFGSEYQFYSLKDTGITDLLNSGVPSLSVRDQARHSELATTEKYIEKRSQVDQRILNSRDSF